MIRNDSSLILFMHMYAPGDYTGILCICLYTRQHVGPLQMLALPAFYASFGFAKQNQNLSAALSTL